MDGHWDAYMFNYEKLSSVLVHGTCYHSNAMAFFNVLLADAVPDHEDHQEEITAQESNRNYLKDLGERLVEASNKAKASDIEYKLAKLDDQWQQLLDLREARVKKLEDTLRAVQQLEKDTNDLRRWLSKVERELSTPETYTSCNLVEIQAKLKVQQELQKDIERHSSSVSSVLSLCEMLLHDNDACSTDADSEALRVTERSLDHRWNNICKLSLERKTKIEETWRLWQKFLEDYSGFADWLTKSEDMLSHPLTVAPFVVIKEEVKKFEAFQRKIHENLAQLEMINKQYRRMARESRTDTNLQLRKMVHEANNRWDDVARRCNKVLRRMKALLTQKEEFDSTRESMIVWLTEMDLQLTNVEHFSESEVSTKVKQMKAFQQEIELNRSRMDEIDDFSKGLMQRCDPSDAATIQEDLDDLHRYADEVFARVSRFQKKLQRLSFAELADIDQMSSGDDGGDYEYSTSSSRDSSPERGDSLTQDRSFQPLVVPQGEAAATSAYSMLPSVSQQQSSRPGSGTPHHRGDSGRQTPTAGGTLEWDTSFDGADETDSKWKYRPRLEGMNQKDLPDLLQECQSRIEALENNLRCPMPTGPESEKEYEEFASLVKDCRVNIEALERHQPGEDNEDEEELLRSRATELAERWRGIQDELADKMSHYKDNSKQWQQFKKDFNKINNWLDKAEDTLNSQGSGVGIEDLEDSFRKYRDFRLGLNTCRTLLHSIKLCSNEFLDPETEEGQELQEKLEVMNHRWEAVCLRAETWRRELQLAIMRSEEFHQSISDLDRKLKECEKSIDKNKPIDLQADQDTLQEAYNLFVQKKKFLESSQPRVVWMKEIADQIFADVDSEDCKSTQKQLHEISKRTAELLKRCNEDIDMLETVVDPTVFVLDEPMTETRVHPVQAPYGSLDSPSPPGSPLYSYKVLTGASSRPLDGDEARIAALLASTSRYKSRRAFLSRVCCAALPLQILMLLLLGVACLIPLTDDEYCCEFANNFANSLQPMLHYTNGPPPT